MKNNSLHIAVLDDFNECFVSSTSDDLRIQVAGWLPTQSVAAPTDAEWAMTLGADNFDTELTSPSDDWISYYKTKSNLGPQAIIKAL